MIYFACPTPASASGGVEKIFQFASALDQAGIPSQIVHNGRSPWRPNWFAARLNGVPAAECVFHVGRDILVIPEIWAPDVDLPSDIPWVCLNQGAYLTYRRAPLPADRAALIPQDRDSFRHPGLLAFICISADSERYLNFTFPDIQVIRVHLGIDTGVFFPGSHWRSHIIAYMPRRRQNEAAELFQIVSRRGHCKRWSVRAIDGLSQADVAKALRECAIFLSLSVREGFALPPLEAMSAGCVVVGYGGRGGDEYFSNETSVRVEDGDTVALARALERVTQAYEAREPWIENLVSNAVLLSRETYTLDRQNREIVAAMQPLMARAQNHSTISGEVPLKDLLPATPLGPSRARRVAHHLRRAGLELIRGR